MPQRLIAAVLLAWTTAASAAQPELACALVPAAAGAVTEGRLSAEPGDPLQLTFFDIEPARRLAMLRLSTGIEQTVSLTVDPNAITFLYELPGIAKTLITVGAKAGDQ